MVFELHFLVIQLRIARIEIYWNYWNKKQVELKQHTLEFLRNIHGDLKSNMTNNICGFMQEKPGFFTIS